MITKNLLCMSCSLYCISELQQSVDCFHFGSQFTEYNAELFRDDELLHFLCRRRVMSASREQENQTFMRNRRRKVCVKSRHCSEQCIIVRSIVAVVDEQIGVSGLCTKESVVQSAAFTLCRLALVFWYFIALGMCYNWNAAGSRVWLSGCGTGSLQSSSIKLAFFSSFISRGVVSASWSSVLWHREQSGVDSLQKFLSRGDWCACVGGAELLWVNMWHIKFN